MRAILLVEAEDGTTPSEVLNTIIKAIEERSSIVYWGTIKKIELFSDTKLGADKEHKEFL